MHHHAFSNGYALMHIINSYQSCIHSSAARYSAFRLNVSGLTPAHLEFKLQLKSRFCRLSNKVRLVHQSFKTWLNTNLWDTGCFLKCYIIFLKCISFLFKELISNSQNVINLCIVSTFLGTFCILVLLLL